MFASIYGVAQNYYNVDQEKVILFSSIFFYAYLISGIPTILICYWRLMASIHICAWISLTGIAIKYFAGNNFWIALVGQVILGIAQGFIYATPSAFSFRWFKENEANPIISVIYYSNSLGVSFGFLIPPFISKNPIETVNLGMLIWSAICCILLLIFATKEYPKKIPSKLALEAINNKEKTNIKETACS